MIYVFPDKRRSNAVAVLMAPLVFMQVLLLHPRNGFRYAAEWAHRSVTDRV